jgi:hypothetical protein
VFRVFNCLQVFDISKISKNKNIKNVRRQIFWHFFAHLAVIKVLNQIPRYNDIMVFPMNAAITIIATLLVILVGKKVLGRYSCYLAF